MVVRSSARTEGGETTDERVQCVNQDTKVTVATWNRSTFSISKDGSLTIDAVRPSPSPSQGAEIRVSKEYKDQVELILATGLAMEGALLSLCQD